MHFNAFFVCDHALLTYAVTNENICHSIAKKRFYTSDHNAHATSYAVMLNIV